MSIQDDLPVLRSLSDVLPELGRSRTSIVGPYAAVATLDGERVCVSQAPDPLGLLQGVSLTNVTEDLAYYREVTPGHWRTVPRARLTRYGMTWS